MKAILAVLLLAAVTNTAAAPAAAPEIITAYTAAGNAVVIGTTNRNDPDRYKVLAADPAAAREITAAKNEAYTLYAIGPGGIYELWVYGYGTGILTDDIIADFQTWDFPSIRSLEWYPGG